MINRYVAAWALGIIFLANFFNYMDRQLVSALEDPLRRAFNLSGGEFGWLWSLFTIGYMVCAVPIGFLGDRFSRTRLLALCIVIWSVATVATGLAGFGPWPYVLFVSRIFIGVGEAGCLVLGPALISDFFSVKSRGKALSLFFLGMPIGGTAAFILPAILKHYEANWPTTLQDYGATWQYMFYLAGVPGFLIAPLVWLLTDPPRGGEVSDHHRPRGARFRDYFQLLRNRTLVLIILAQAFAVIIIIPLIHFGKKFFMDKHNLSELQAGVSLGGMALVAGLLGNSLSGVLGDLLARRYKGAYALLAGIGFLAGWPCLVLGFYTTNQSIFLPALTLGCFFYFLCMPAVNTQIANVVAPTQRATAWAMAVFILHLLGDLTAPPIFGEVSDHLSWNKAGPIVIGNQILTMGGLANGGNGILGIPASLISMATTQDELSTVERGTTFMYFSFAMILAGLCCLLAAWTARGDIRRFVPSELIEVEKKEVENNPVGATKED